MNFILHIILHSSAWGRDLIAYPEHFYVYGALVIILVCIAIYFRQR